MVQFGKTLNEVVKTEWRSHAVAYMEMKRAISKHGGVNHPGHERKRSAVGAICAKGSVETEETAPNDFHNDGDSVHTESSYSVSDSQKAEFFRIFDDSVSRLCNFYKEKAIWAKQKCSDLQMQVEQAEAQRKAQIEQNHHADPSKADAREEKQEEGEEEKSSAGAWVEESPPSVSFVVLSLNNYMRDLELFLEFLELNATAFSKIMKKYDKRTSSCLREEKLKELRTDYPYLYDGGDIRKFKRLASEWLQALESNVGTKTRKHLSWDSSATRTTFPLPSLPQVEQANDVENPQCSDSSGTGTASIDTFGSVARRADEGSVVVNNQSSRLRLLQSRNVSRDVVHETPETRIVRNMIDKVNEELYLQKLNSPFFKKNSSETPPFFSDGEVETKEELGHGEFCKIYEVTKFNVPESCHICFLHRGFNDPDPLVRSPDPPAVIENIASLEEKQETGEKFPSVLATASRGDDQKIISSFSFNFDCNISDYDELEDDHADEFDHETRGFMKDHCLRNNVSRYAIKRIRGSLAGEDHITEAAIDLAREAEFLASLSHPNIIKIRGTINVPGHPKYSLILDRLYDTLEIRMRKWKDENDRYKGKVFGLIGKNKAKLNMIWVDRLLAAYDLARALAYLHSCGILHRDIKPSNIGFDIRDDIKLFDFGLAKELKPIQRVGKDQYHTSGIAGTRRYMAPEIAKIVPYGFSADVYSFGIVMWEMLTLNSAFPKYSRERHYREVIVEGKRPKVPRSWPFVVSNLLKRCWDPEPSERPTFQAICQLIKFGLPDDSIGSERSNELLLRSLRSTNGGNNLSESECKSSMYDTAIEDSLSKSIRKRCSHPTCA